MVECKDPLFSVERNPKVKGNKAPSVVTQSRGKSAPGDGRRTIGDGLRRTVKSESVEEKLGKLHCKGWGVHESNQKRQGRKEAGGRRSASARKHLCLCLCPPPLNLSVVVLSFACLRHAQGQRFGGLGKQGGRDALEARHVLEWLALSQPPPLFHTPPHPTESYSFLLSHHIFVPLHP